MSNINLPARYRAFHAAGGAFLYSALGAAWALVGALALRPFGMAWLNLLLGLITGLLLIASVRALQRADYVPDSEMDDSQREERERRSWRSRKVLRAEGFAITAASVGLLLAQLHAYIAPVTSLIVGLHFVALAPIHKNRGEYVIGGLMVALSAGTMLWGQHLGIQEGPAMNALAGLGTAVVLWCASVWRLVEEERAWSGVSPEKGDYPG